MLLLTRRIGEEVIIGRGEGAVVVRVVAVNRTGSQVRLAIEAPRDVEVDRAEIRARKVREERACG